MAILTKLEKFLIKTMRQDLKFPGLYADKNDRRNERRRLKRLIAKGKRKRK